MAAPIVSGIAAQLFAREPATFSVWPEPLRALIMTGAIRHVPIPGGSGQYPDQEGVGVVDAIWSARIYAKATAYGGWTKGAVTQGSSNVTQSFSVTAGQRVRIDLAWDSSTSGPIFDKIDTLTTDLDLSVTYPGGTKQSLSWDNSYEHVAFTAPSSGTVTITVRKVRFDGPTSYWGLAWLKF